VRYSITVVVSGRSARTDPRDFEPPRLKEDVSVSENISHVSDATFEQEVINADGPVLVDYWAEWCGPCKMIDPLLHELADEFGGKIKIAKVNIDENQQITSQFKIRGIPTLMVFRDGKVQGMKVGAVTKGVLKDFIAEHV
jgi:thioredoxin 1